VAKIRTQFSSGKIITKGGKVSCSCCGGECCLYPGEDAYGIGLLTNDDLPDELELWFSSRDPEPKLYGPAIATYNGNATWGSFNNGEGPSVEWAEDGWVVIYAGGGPGGPAACLLPTPFDAVPVAGLNDRYYVFDRFEDTYTFNITFEDQFDSGTLVRESLCVWTNPSTQTESLNTLLSRIGYGGTDGTSNKWEDMADNDFQAIKSGFQNKPSGIYTVSGLYAGATLEILE